MPSRWTEAHTPSVSYVASTQHMFVELNEGAWFLSDSTLWAPVGIFLPFSMNTSYLIGSGPAGSLPLHLSSQHLFLA